MNIPVCCMLTIVIISEMNLSEAQDRCVTIVLIPTLTLQFTPGTSQGPNLPNDLI